MTSLRVSTACVIITLSITGTAIRQESIRRTGTPVCLACPSTEEKQAGGFAVLRIVTHIHKPNADPKWSPMTRKAYFNEFVMTLKRMSTSGASTSIQRPLSGNMAVISH